MASDIFSFPTLPLPLYTPGFSHTFVWLGLCSLMLIQGYMCTWELRGARLVDRCTDY